MKSGDKKGRLTAIKFVDRSRWGYQRWLFKCDCGTEKIILLPSIVSGNTLSCGCIKRDRQKKIMSKHGMAGTPTYQSWLAMRRRCLDKKFSKYRDYGAKGITVCDKWFTFEGFFEDMGVRPKDKTLGRINNKGNYEKENCRWETSRQQANNTKRNIYLSYGGKTMTIAQWARKLNISQDLIRNRIIVSNWDVEKAFSEPVRDWAPGRRRPEIT